MLPLLRNSTRTLPSLQDPQVRGREGRRGHGMGLRRSVAGGGFACGHHHVELAPLAEKREPGASIPSCAPRSPRRNTAAVTGGQRLERRLNSSATPERHSPDRVPLSSAPPMLCMRRAVWKSYRASSSSTRPPASKRPGAARCGRQRPWMPAKVRLGDLGRDATNDQDRGQSLALDLVVATVHADAQLGRVASAERFDDQPRQVTRLDSTPTSGLPLNGRRARSGRSGRRGVGR
jgi:hypothetical protein